VRQFVDAVRRDGAAGVLVRVDHRREQARRTEDRVEIQAQFAGDRVIRPEAGRGHDPIDRDGTAAVGHPHTVGGDVEAFHAEAGEQGDGAVVDVGA
jgi:hypothetical protein